MTALRLRCCVMFCKRTTGQGKIEPGTEWLCREHWALVPKHLKKRRAKLRRIDRKNPENDFTHYRCLALDWKIWNRCKEYAIERAAGI